MQAAARERRAVAMMRLLGLSERIRPVTHTPHKNACRVIAPRRTVRKDGIETLASTSICSQRRILGIVSCTTPLDRTR